MKYSVFSRVEFETPRPVSYLTCSTPELLAGCQAFGPAGEEELVR